MPLRSATVAPVPTAPGASDARLSAVAPRASAPGPGPQVAFGDALIVYVEDNPVNAMLVAELVGRSPGTRLVIAEDGARGLERVRALRPNLVLLDMQLPDIDGHEVLRVTGRGAVTILDPARMVSNAHEAHHSSAYCNLTTALRQSWLSPLYS